MITGNNNISLAEFKVMLPKLASWGVKIGDPDAEYKIINTNGKGGIDFNEFKEWALNKQLDLEEDDD